MEQENKFYPIKIVIFFLFFPLISCDTCKDCIENITILNNSQKTLVFYYSIDYPDTSLKNLQGCFCSSIIPQTKCNCSAESGWNHSNKYGILLFYIWDNDTVIKYGFNNCNDKILKKYQYSVSDLENLNWTITYP